ncbi:MAG: hypothetical protein HC880_02205 [Bacteroidia bacterium]|nr:hypothetical protein [Bacteroidia bacterium]
MKKLFFIVCFLFSGLYAFATEAPVPQKPEAALVDVSLTKKNLSENLVEDEAERFAQCEITDGGFHASGNCKAVLRAYQRYLALQEQEQK